MGPALRRMRAAGVQFAASTDAGAIPNLAHHRLCDGVVMLARTAGMGYAEALRSATTGGAAALGIEAVCGALREGMAADILVVAADPLEDMEGAICVPPLAVVCRGVLVPPCGGVPSAAQRSGLGALRLPSWTSSGVAGGGFGLSEGCACNVR